MLLLLEDDVQDNPKYRAGESDWEHFVRTHSADEIMAEFDKPIKPSKTDTTDPYYGKSESEATIARQLDIISTMLNVYGNINNIETVKKLVKEHLSHSLWCDWFISMKPEEIMKGTNSNTFMFLVNKDLDQLTKNEVKFKTIYNAYCRNCIDEVSNSSQFANFVVKDAPLWESNLSAGQKMEVMQLVNDEIENGMKFEDLKDKIVDLRGKLWRYVDIEKNFKVDKNSNRRNIPAGKKTDNEVNSMLSAVKKELEANPRQVQRLAKDQKLTLNLDED